MKHLSILSLLVFSLLLTGCSFDAGEHTEVTINAPETMVVGETVLFGATIKNTDSQEHVLDSIDIANAFLEAFPITSIEPYSRQNTHIPLLDQRSFEFGTVIGPKEELDVEFLAKATEAGVHTGSFDVCIDELSDCLYGTIEITVTHN